MRVWVFCVIAFFAIAELYQWLQAQVQGLPLPVYGAAGLLLAALSNADRWRHLLPSRPVSSLNPDPQPVPPTPSPDAAPRQTV
jgi:hypothetical protein